MRLQPIHDPPGRLPVAIRVPTRRHPGIGLRIAVQPPPAWEIALSIGLLLLAIWGVAWFAGRIYRVGILMYGKKPTFPEILRWARAAD